MSAPPEMPAGTASPDRPARRRRRGGRGEQLMVPDAEFTSYYERPILKEPTWKALDIAGYLFLGGLAGASSITAAGAEWTGRPVMARASKIGAAGAISLSLVALVHDLGRPGRFVNMLRVFKPSSPMSVGSWLLSAYAPLAFASAGSDLTGRFRPAGRAAGLGAAALGAGVATYTAVLVADTATPAWHDAYQELPVLFAGSATAAAAGLALVAAPPAETGPVRRAAVLGAAVELAATHRLETGLGLASEAYQAEKPARLLHLARGFTVAGAAGAALGGRNRVAAAISGALLLAGSACTRFGIFAAGVESARDPKYVVVPQRERLDARAARTTASAP